MFKAKLIDDPSFYSLKFKNHLVFFLSAILVGGLSSYYMSTIWGIIITLIAYGVIIVLMKKDVKNMNAITESSTIEIGDELIVLKSKKNKPEMKIDLNTVDKIILNKEYKLPEEPFLKKIKGDYKKHFVIIEQGGEQQRFEFLIESFYMITQLEEVIKSWKQKGIIVERQ